MWRTITTVNEQRYFLHTVYRTLLTTKDPKTNLEKNVLGNINLTKQLPYENDQLNVHKDILFEDFGKNGLITLNRPSILNALNLPMIKQIRETLLKWKEFKQLVMIEGAGNKAFSAGSDLSTFQSTSQSMDIEYGYQFFREMLGLVYLITKYKSPYIAVMDNITMGAGAVLSIHGKYRIVTENSIFSMPEVSSGYFPNSGTTYVLPRLTGELGTFIGLTTHKLKGADILHSGIATHYVPAAKLPEVKDRILKSDPMKINDILREYESDYCKNKFSLAPYMKTIEHCFSAPTIEEMFNRLKADESDWAKETAKIMSFMSPTSLKITHEAYQRGRQLDLIECLKMEYRLICSLLVKGSEFEKTSIAFLNKTTKPEWNPKSLKDVTAESVLERLTPLELFLEAKIHRIFYESA